ncbi:Glycosyl hydrolase, five-bladed beta-propellor domain [Phytophthora cactorum]|nr:Glycosyl hydrolase, five-bladed beta-propellor domain [Phytophthora cactorum]
MFPLPPLHDAVRTAAVVGKACKPTKTAGINHLAIGYGHSHGNYYYLFMSKGSCCGYDKKRPAPGKEYRILACRSSNATGSFVDKDGVDCKKGVALLCSNRTTSCTGLVVRASITTRSMDLSCTIITSTRRSDMPTVRSGLGGTRSISQAGGQLCELE